MIPWTVARQASLSTGSSSQEYWSGLPCPPPNLGPKALYISSLTFPSEKLLWHFGSLFNAVSLLNLTLLEQIFRGSFGEVYSIEVTLRVLVYLLCVHMRSVMSASLWTPWTLVCQIPLSMGFSRQEYWSGLPFPSSEDLPDLEIEPASLASPALAGRNPALKILLYCHSRKNPAVGVYAMEAEYHMDIHRQFCFLKLKSPCSTQKQF